MKLLNTRASRLICCGLLFISLAACSTLSAVKPLAPKVELIDIAIVKMGFTNQELAFTLDVYNPNGFDLPVNLLEFTASSGEAAVASGRTTERVLLPAREKTQVTVDVIAQANRLIQQLLASAISESARLDYNVTGFVKLDNWPARIPFDVDKSLSLDDLQR